MVEAKLDGASAGLIVPDRSEGAQKQLADSVPTHLRPPAAVALASLGSVLLGQARPHEALGVLASAQTLAPEHPAFDDVRWMLGQALLCSASREWRSDFSFQVRRSDPNWRETGSAQLDAIDALRQEAAVVLDRVRDHERAREGRPFAGRTDIAGSLNACRGDWLASASDQEARGRIRYALKQIVGRGRGYLCGRLGVRAPRLPGEEEVVYLRVWGGGAERLRLEAGEDGLDRRSDVISLAPTSNRFYYFAQLENEGGRPLSAPLALDPRAVPPMAASPSAARCADARTLITLTVEQPADPEPALPEGRRSGGRRSKAVPLDGAPDDGGPGTAVR
jgi:hypothetical protein